MEDKNNNILAIGLGLTLVIASNLIGHDNPPFSIMVTPILLTTIIACINYPLYKSNLWLTVIYNYGLLLFNDLFIRYHAGGIHDSQGNAWIVLFFFISFALGFIVMIIYGIINAHDEKINPKLALKNVTIVLFGATLTGLLYYYVLAKAL